MRNLRGGGEVRRKAEGWKVLKSEANVARTTGPVKD